MEASPEQQLILKKKKLIDISKNLTKVEYIEIFNIIKVYYKVNIAGKGS